MPEPRVNTQPGTAVGTYGDIAAALMERARRPLLDWQRDSADVMLGYRADMMWAAPEFVEWCPRQNGKGLPLEARVLTGLLVLGEELILWSAHETKTAFEMFRRVVGDLRNMGEEINENLIIVDGMRIKVGTSNGKESIERLDPICDENGTPLVETRSRIKFIARSKNSGRGFSGDVKIIDEAFSYEEEQIDAQQPTESARPNPQTIYASTPPLSPITGSVMYRLRHRGDPTAPRLPSDGPWVQDPELAYRDWGAGGDLEHLDQVDLDSPETLAATNPSYGRILRPAAVARERRSMSPQGFARERYGIWPHRALEEEDGGSGCIDMEKWGSIQLAPEQIQRPERLALAVVINAQRSKTVIAACGARKDGRLQVSLADVRPGTEWAVARLAKLGETAKPVVIVAQDKGPTATLLAELIKPGTGLKRAADRDKPFRGDIVVPWAQDVADAYGLFIDGFLGDRLRQLGEAELLLSAKQAQTRALGSGTAWDYKLETAAELNAVTLAYWGYVKWAPVVRERSDDSGVWVV